MRIREITKEQFLSSGFAENDWDDYASIRSVEKITQGAARRHFTAQEGGDARYSSLKNSLIEVLNRQKPLDVTSYMPDSEKSFFSRIGSIFSKKFGRREISEREMALQQVLSLFLEDRDALIEIAGKSPHVFELCEELREDPLILLEAIKKDGNVYTFASDRLKNDRQFFLDALKENSLVMALISDSMKEELNKSREFALDACKINPLIFGLIGSFRDDEEIALEVIKKTTQCYFWMSKRLQQKEEVALAAIQVNPYLLRQELDEHLRNNKEIVLVAVSRDGSLLKFASEELKADRDVLLAAVRSNPYSLQFATREMNNDEEIVVTAVAKNGLALEHVSEELKNNKAIAWTAIRQNVEALRLIGNELKRDKEFCREVLYLHPLALEYFEFSSEETNSKEARNFSEKFNDVICSKVRNKELQRALLKVAFLYEEEIQNDERFVNLNWDLKIVALSLLVRLQDKEQVLSMVGKITEGPVRKALKNAYNSLMQNLLELLLTQTPRLSTDEIGLLFNNFPREKEKISPILLKEQLSYIGVFLKTQPEERRAVLSSILREPSERQMALLKEPLVELISFFGVEEAAPILASSRVQEIITYLQKQKENRELYSTIQYFLQGIVQGTLSDKRYLELGNRHIKELAKGNLDVWERWKGLSFSSQDVRAETVLTAYFSFNSFLNEKLVQGHLPKEFEDALHRDLREINREERQGFFDCLSYLKKHMGQDKCPSVSELNEGITLFSAHYPSCAFIDDLKSLLPHLKREAKTIELSDNWEDLFGCGTDVLGSCQNVFGDPNLNKCLLAYVLDGKNRLLCAKDDQGKIVGRVILRLLLQENNSSAIYMEPYYGERAYQTAVEEAAKEVANLSGVDLYCISSSYSGPRLRSLGSSVPFEYSDGERKVTGGVFSHFAELIHTANS